jgi:hypothetical protein
LLFRFVAYDQRTEHKREARHWVDVLSDWGGLHGILFSMASILVMYFNDQLKEAKFIRNLFVKKSGKMKKKKIKTSLLDIFRTFKVYKWFFKEKHEGSELIMAGQE